jgi:arrestin-related trafficking adapter 3/6
VLAACLFVSIVLTHSKLERTDYYTGTDPTRIARTDAIQRFPLLSSEVVSKEGDSSFPDNLEASKRSLFYHIATAENDLSKALPSQVGPSPWTFQRSLVLPTSCTRIHVSNKNRRANIMISHTLDVIFRIEREDDGSVDRRKLFDVTVQVPVNILSVSISLPCYTSQSA